MDIFVWIQLTVFGFVFNGPVLTNLDYPPKWGSPALWTKVRPKISPWQNYGSSFGKLQNQATVLPTEVDTALTFVRPDPTTSIYPSVLVSTYNDPSYSRLAMKRDFYSNRQKTHLLHQTDQSHTKSSFGFSKTSPVSDELISVTPPLPVSTGAMTTNIEPGHVSDFVSESTSVSTGAMTTSIEPDHVSDFASESISPTPSQPSSINTVDDSSSGQLGPSLLTPGFQIGYKKTEYNGYTPGHYQTHSVSQKSSTALVKPPINCDSSLLSRIDITKATCERQQAVGDFFCFDDFPSCKDRCGRFFPSSCSCDVYCEIYHNCCDDFKGVCPDEWNHSKQIFSSLLEVNISCLKYAKGYLVIASCPPNTNTTEDYKCQHGSEMPISVHNFHFKNIHCLRCNGFKDENAMLWSVEVSVYFEDFEEEDAFSIGEGVSEHLSNTGVYAWKTPESANNLHTCHRAMISSCPPDSPLDVQDKCQSVRAPVTVVERKDDATNIRATSRYGNKYCAECNVRSSYVCVGSSRDYYITNQGHGRFSNIINWHIIDNKTILSAGPMSQWKTMTCNGSNFDSMSMACKMEMCHGQLVIVNNKCSVSLVPHCATFILELGLHQRDESTCTNDTCLRPLFHTIMATLINVTNSTYSGMSLAEMAINPSKVQLSFKMKFKKSNEARESPTWPRLLSIYSPTVNDILVHRGFTGMFWFCAMSSRYDKCEIDCKTRNYTIHGPATPRPAVSSRSAITQPLLLVIMSVALCTRFVVIH
ncbi:hypothetical protein SNE40_007014 [Patella caerulea]|uniref:SMB domain-containing protein n=1 Tax=Patella caerulea TaxID=87958 RepID=A0AAN8JYS4_PATCE